MQPLIVCAAITGGGPARSKTPHQPVTPQAVADEAVACWRAGAAVVHIHARLADETTSSEINAYRDIADRIRAAGCDAILSLSAGGTADARAMSNDCVWRRRENCLARSGPYQSRRQALRQTAAYLREMGTQLEIGVRPERVLDSGHPIDYRLIKDGLVKPPYNVHWVCVRAASARLLSAGAQCRGCRLNGCSRLHPCQTSVRDVRASDGAFLEGGHVRTRMEDHIYWDRKIRAQQGELVEQWPKRRHLEESGEPADARRMLVLRRVARQTRKPGMTQPVRIALFSYN